MIHLLHLECDPRHQNLGERHGMGFPSEPPEGANFANLNFGLLVFRTVKEKIPVVFSHSFCGDLLKQF